MKEGRFQVTPSSFTFTRTSNTRFTLLSDPSCSLVDSVRLSLHIHKHLLPFVYFPAAQEAILSQAKE